MSHPGHAGPSFGQTEILYSIIPPPFLFEHDFDFGGGSGDSGGNLIAILKQIDRKRKSLLFIYSIDPSSELILRRS